MFPKNNSFCKISTNYLTGTTYRGQIIGEDFVKFCGFLRIYGSYIQWLCQQPLAAFEKLTGQFISRARGHLACQFRRIIKLRDWPWPKITYKAFENILFLILITYLQLCKYIHSQLFIFFERYTHYLYKFIIHKCIWNSKGVSFVFLNTTNSKFLHANFTIFYGLTFLVFLIQSRYLIKAK